MDPQKAFSLLKGAIQEKGAFLARDSWTGGLHKDVVSVV